MTSVGPWGRRDWRAAARNASRSRFREEGGGAGAATLQAHGVEAKAGAGRPAVLFCDPAGYEQFDQLAITLRRLGIASIKVAPCAGGPYRAPSFMRRLRDRWFYDRRISLGTAADVAALQAGGLDGLRVVDTLVGESVVAERGLDDPVLEALGRRSLSFVRHAPRVLFDKFEVNALLEAAGVRIPPQCSAATFTPAQAVRALGLPLVVKARVGIGGNGVRVARSEAEVEEALHDLCGEDLAHGFFQAYVDGQAVGYLGVRGPSGFELEKGYRVTAIQWALGPSARVTHDDDPALVAAGRGVMEALGCQAFAQIDMIRDAEGKVWPIDANLRPSANTLSFLCLGLDPPEAYARLVLGGRPSRARPAVSPQADTAEVMPFGLYDAVRHGSAGRVAAVTRQFLWICRRGPGWRYGLVVTGKALSLLAGRLTRLGTRQSSSVPNRKFAASRR